MTLTDLTVQVMPNLVCCHDVGLHVGILSACRSQVSIQEGALTADGRPHQLHFAYQAGRQDTGPVHKCLQSRWLLTKA
jgi:hypothetical protein